MEKIKVYNIDLLVQQHHPEYAAFRYKKAAIFEGSKGVVFAEHEAAHQRSAHLTDCVVVPLCDRPSKGHMAVMATSNLVVSLDEIVANAPFEEKTFKEFFNRRYYNPRCQNNYANLMRSLRAVGFDLQGYLADALPLEQQIGSAAALRREAVKSEKEAGLCI